MHTPKDQTLYGLMTHYDSNNFCWIQPTLAKSTAMPVEFDRYTKRINRYARMEKLEPVEEVKIGMDCLAKYEADKHWYRAVVVADEQQGQWLLLFIDYGNFQRTYVSDMAMPLIEPTISHYHPPLQAVCCRLYNIVPRVPAARLDIDQRLEEFYANHIDKYLEIKVRQVRTDFIVDCDIFLPEEVKYENDNGDRLYRRHIGQSCVDDGLATFADPIAAHSVKTKTEM